MKHVLIASALALGACAPMVWNRPDTSPQQFAMDRARCTLTAKGITPEQDTRSVFKTASANLGSAIGDGIVNGLNLRENFSLCMEAIGYERTQ